MIEEKRDNRPGQPVLERVVRKKKESGSEGSASGLLWVVLALQAIALGILGWMMYSSGQAPGSALQTGASRPVSGSATQQIMAAAGELMNKGVYKGALELYRQAFLSSELSPRDSAVAAYRAGTIAMDNLQDFDGAMPWLTLARTLEPQGDLARDCAKRLIACLERTGRSRAAKNLLDSAASLKPQSLVQADASQTVARIGDRAYTYMELEKWVPQHQRSGLETRQGRMDLLRQFLTRELLWDSGQRRNLQDSPEVSSRVEEYRRDLVADRVMRDETSGATQVDAQMLETYYKANMDKWTDPDTLAMTAWVFADQTAAAHWSRDLRTGKTPGQVTAPAGVTSEGSQGIQLASNGQPLRTLQISVRSDARTIRELPDLSAEQVSALLASKADETIGPLRMKDSWIVTRVDSRVKGQTRPYDSVRSSVEQACRNERVQKRAQEFIESLLTGDRVKIEEKVLYQGLPQEHNSDGGAK